MPPSVAEKIIKYLLQSHPRVPYIVLMQFTAAQALLAETSPSICESIDLLAELIVGGPQGRTAYMAGAARKRHAAISETRFRLHNQPQPEPRPMTDADYPSNCGSRFD